MKGFLVAVAAIAGVFYWIHQNDPARSGDSGVGATGIAVEINPGNYESQVKQSGVPVLAYFWAPW